MTLAREERGPRNVPSGSCTAVANNSGSCDHTAIATQISGRSID